MSPKGPKRIPKLAKARPGGVNPLKITTILQGRMLFEAKEARLKKAGEVYERVLKEKGAVHRDTTIAKIRELSRRMEMHHVGAELAKLEVRAHAGEANCGALMKRQRNHEKALADTLKEIHDLLKSN